MPPDAGFVGGGICIDVTSPVPGKGMGVGVGGVYVSVEGMLLVAPYPLPDELPLPYELPLPDELPPYELPLPDELPPLE